MNKTALQSGPRPSDNTPFATPYKLLKNYGVHPIISKLLERTDLMGLDIGCALPNHLWDLYHDFGFDKLVGVEQRSRAEVIEEFATKKYFGLNKNDAKSEYDFYKKGYGKLADEGTFDFRPVLTNDEYKNHIEVNYETSSDQFASRVVNWSKFDFIILSNVLHLFGANQLGREIQSFTHDSFNYLHSCLKRGGLMYIRVNHQDNPNSIENTQIKFTKESLMNFLGGRYEILHLEEEKDEKDAKKHSIVFFGIKKGN